MIRPPLLPMIVVASLGAMLVFAATMMVCDAWQGGCVVSGRVLARAF